MKFYLSKISPPLKKKKNPHLKWQDCNSYSEFHSWFKICRVLEVHDIILHIAVCSKYLKIGHSYTTLHAQSQKYFHHHHHHHHHHHSFTGTYSPGWTFGLPFGVSWSHTYRHHHHHQIFLSFTLVIAHN
jgi:hypothetical protein